MGDLLKRLGLVVDAELEDLDSLEEGIDAWTRAMDAAEDKAGVLTQAVGKLDSGLKDYAKQAADVRDRSEKIALMWNILMERGVSSAQATKILAGELAQLQTKTKGLADSDLPNVTQKLLALGKGVDEAGNKFFKLQVSGQYIEGVNRGVGQLLQSVSAVNPALADLAQRGQQISIGIGSAAKGITEYLKAGSGLEKVAAGTGIALSGMAVALQLVDLWIKKIDKDTEEYVQGAQRRYFGALQTQETQERQTNAAREAGWTGFDKGKTKAENYAAALEYLTEKGIKGLVTGEHQATIEAAALEKSLESLGVVTEGQVTKAATALGKALDGLTSSGRLTQEEAVERLGPAFEQLAEDSGKLTERELPAQARELLQLAKTYGVVGDAAKDSAAAQLTATQTAIAAIREKLVPANQALLDVMTKLDGATEASSLAQAENIRWTQEQAAAHVKAAEAAGEYVPFTERLAAGLEASTEAMEGEESAAEDATVAKLELGEAEDSLADSADNVTESMDESAQSMEESSDTDSWEASFQGADDATRMEMSRERFGTLSDPADEFAGFWGEGGAGAAAAVQQQTTSSRDQQRAERSQRAANVKSDEMQGRTMANPDGGGTMIGRRFDSSGRPLRDFLGDVVKRRESLGFGQVVMADRAARPNKGPGMLGFSGSFDGGGEEGGVEFGTGQDSFGDGGGGGGGGGGGRGAVASEMTAGLSAAQLASAEQTQALTPSVVTERDIGAAGANARADLVYAHGQGQGEAAGQVSTEAIGTYLRLEKLAELLDVGNPQ
jgi:uncharacterized protein YoaH (UPF0181 family)